MDSKMPLELLKARAKLERLINQDAPYEKIYKQSKVAQKRQKVPFFLCKIPICSY